MNFTAICLELHTGCNKMMPIYDAILIYGIFEILSIQTFCRCDYYITEVSILQGNPAKQVLKKLHKNRAVEIGYFSQLCFLCNITFLKFNSVRTALLR